MYKRLDPATLYSGEYEELSSELLRIMRNVQRSRAVHGKALVSAIETISGAVQEASEEEEGAGVMGVGSAVFSLVVDVLGSVLEVKTKEPGVERLVVWLSGFLTQLGDDSLGLALLARFLPFHTAAASHVRQRVTFVVGMLLNTLTEAAEIDEDLWAAITSAMSERLIDRIPAVRAAAVVALERMQILPEDEDDGDDEDQVVPSLDTPLKRRKHASEYMDADGFDDPVLASFVSLLQTDSSKDVRSSVLHKLALAPSTLPLLLERTRDVQPKVRKTAFAMLAAKVDMRGLNIAQRVALLDAGLRDRSPAVRTAALNMMYTGWLRECFEGNVPAFLDALDVIEYEDALIPVLTALFEKDASNTNPADIVFRAPFTPDQLAKNGDAIALTPESAFYWRNLVRFISAKGKKAAGALYLPEEALVPAIADFTALICGYYNQALALSQQLLALRPAGSDSDDDDNDNDSSEPESDDEHDPEVDEAREALEESYEAMVFVTKQLLILGRDLDFTDEAGRRTLAAFLRQLFVATIDHDESLFATSLLIPAAQLLFTVHPDEISQLTTVTAIVGDLMEAIEDTTDQDAILEANFELTPELKDRERSLKVQVASIHVKLQEATDAKKAAAAADNFDAAAAAKAMIDELLLQEAAAQVEFESEVDAAKARWIRANRKSADELALDTESAYLRALAVVRELYAATDATMDSPLLSSLQTTLVLESITSPSPDVRAAAIAALATSITLYPTPPLDLVSLLVSVLDNETMTSQVKALTGLFDALLKFGVDTRFVDASGGGMESNSDDDEGSDQDDFEEEDKEEEEEEEEEEDERQLLFTKLSQYLAQDEAERLRGIAVRGMCKMLLFARVAGEKATSVCHELIRMFFLPGAEEDVDASQVLSVFFPYLAAQPHGKTILREAVTGVMQTIFEASRSAVESDISLFKVLQFAISLLSAEMEDPREIHEDLATEWLATLMAWLSSKQFVVGNVRHAKNCIKHLARGIVLLDVQPSQTMSLLASGAVEELFENDCGVAARALAKFSAKVIPPEEPEEPTQPEEDAAAQPDGAAVEPEAKAKAKVTEVVEEKKTRASGRRSRRTLEDATNVATE